ncbi:MAG: hypothetical protein KF696_12430 [Planctomycetes bacterium]|nr:hypothetical protein [Planctomycetota bacterium]MCW8136605.1 hypothetical protein [Planctomycetota bacterium]
MKRVLAVIAILGLMGAPAFAQEHESKTESKTSHVKIVRTGDGKVHVEARGDGVEVQVSDDMKQRLEEIKKKLEEVREKLKKHEAVDLDEIFKRLDEVLEKFGHGKAHRVMPEGDWHKEIEKRMEEMRKQHEDAFERLRKQMEGLENEPEAEVEEWEETSKDGKSHVKIKIVRKTSKSESGDHKEDHREEKKTEERKQ